MATLTPNTQRNNGNSANMGWTRALFGTPRTTTKARTASASTPMETPTSYINISNRNGFTSPDPFFQGVETRFDACPSPWRHESASPPHGRPNAFGLPPATPRVNFDSIAHPSFRFRERGEEPTMDNVDSMDVTPSRKRHAPDSQEEDEDPLVPLNQCSNRYNPSKASKFITELLQRRSNRPENQPNKILKRLGAEGFSSPSPSPSFMDRPLRLASMQVPVRLTQPQMNHPRLPVESQFSPNEKSAWIPHKRVRFAEPTPSEQFMDPSVERDIFSKRRKLRRGPQEDVQAMSVEDSPSSSISPSPKRQRLQNRIQNSSLGGWATKSLPKRPRSWTPQKPSKRR